MIAFLPNWEQHIGLVVPLIIGIVGLWAQIRKDNQKLDAKIEKIYIAVNGRLTDTMNEVKKLEEEVRELKEPKPAQPTQRRRR